MVFKYLAISALVATSSAYRRPKSSHSTYYALFGAAPDVNAIKAEQDRFQEDGGELYDDMDTSLMANVQFTEYDTYSAGPGLMLGDAGTSRGRSGKRGSGKRDHGKKGKFEGGKKGEYVIEEGDFETGTITKPQGPPMPEKLFNFVSKIFAHLEGNTCKDGCSKHCTFDDVADNIKHHACRKCVRMECKAVVKKFLHSSGHSGKPGHAGKGGKRGSGKRGSRGDSECRKQCLASDEIKAACKTRRSKECKGAVRSCFRNKC